jgi:acyl-CoA thioester hydrolase
MLGRPHEYPLTIIESHLDTFGHVNNATYLRLLEDARWQWITEGGYGLGEVRRRGQGPTILKCTLEFKRELVNREQIRIRSWLESYSGKIAVVRQTIIRGEDEVCCEAHFVMALFDVKQRRLIEPTDEWLACVGLSRADWSSKSLA